MKKTFAVLVATILVVTALCACMTVSAETTNVALGKSYTISQQFRQSTETWTWDDNAPIAYPDNGGELTDGKFPGEDSGYGDDAWVGFHGGAPEYKDKLGYSYIRIDLGEVYKLSELKAYLGSKKLGSGITAPTTVEFYVSEDGETYTGLGEITPEDTDASAIVVVSQETDASARYVELRMKRDGNWMFIAEVEAYADASSAGAGSSDDGSKDDDKSDDNSTADDSSTTDDNSTTDDSSKTDESSKTDDTPSTPSESTSSGSDKVPTGDAGILFFALLGVTAVAGLCVAVRKHS